MSDPLELAEAATGSDERSSWALVSIARSLNVLANARSVASPSLAPAPLAPPTWLVDDVRVRVTPNAMFTDLDGALRYTAPGARTGFDGVVVGGSPDNDGDVTVRRDGDGVVYDTHWSFLERIK